MLELSWRGSKPVPLTEGGERKFLQVKLVLYCAKCKHYNSNPGWRQCSHDWSVQRRRVQCWVWCCGRCSSACCTSGVRLWMWLRAGLKVFVWSGAEGIKNCSTNENLCFTFVKAQLNRTPFKLEWHKLFDHFHGTLEADFWYMLPYFNQWWTNERFQGEQSNGQFY